MLLIDSLRLVKQHVFELKHKKAAGTVLNNHAAPLLSGIMCTVNCHIFGQCDNASYSGILFFACRCRDIMSLSLEDSLLLRRMPTVCQTPDGGIYNTVPTPVTCFRQFVF